MKHVEDIRTQGKQLPAAGGTVCRGDEGTALSGGAARPWQVLTKLAEKVVHPLTGKEDRRLLWLPASPSRERSSAFDNPENPKIMEDFIRAIGAEPVIYPYRNECCGGYISLKEKELTGTHVQGYHRQRSGLWRRYADHRLSALQVQPRTWPETAHLPVILFYRASC